MSEPSAPDYTGLVAGVRTWRLANTLWAKMGGWLWSLAMTDCWRKGEEWKQAECRHGHRIPGDDCMCGIWAFFDVETMERQFGPVLTAASTTTPVGERYEHVSGIIGAGGDIVEHEYGFRAQYAKVMAIFEDGLPTPKTEIAEMYPGTTIVAPAEYDAFCREHGLIRLDRE